MSNFWSTRVTPTLFNVKHSLLLTTEVSEHHALLHTSQLFQIYSMYTKWACVAA
jgi:hypothetical protein